ncbi:MAG: GTPase Era [Acidobacteriota bacterium]
MAKSGIVSLIGRPNAGKSTLLNRVLKEKISIVSDKPQTTRHRILGIHTGPLGQIVFVDTPGIHKPGYELNRRMMQAVYDSMEGTDILVLLVDATESFGSGDQFVLDLIKTKPQTRFLALNKIDLLPKEKLLALMALYSGKCDFAEIVPISALKGENLELMEQLLFKYLPEGPPLYPEDQLTDRSQRFIAAEMVREKVLFFTHEELPYTTTVLVTRYEELEDLDRIHCEIFVEKESQRRIVIGKGGRMLKQIGTEARKEIEALVGKRVYLELFVKVRTGWRDDARFLDDLSLPPASIHRK